VSPALERRLLQATMALVLLVPLAGAGQGIAQGIDWLGGTAPTRSLDSHFRYLSGLLLAMALLFASCVPGVERKGARLRLLAVLPVTGGLARLWALVSEGRPGTAHLVALAIELGAVPLLVLWQARVARRCAVAR
jgi:hypothetical protein